MSSTKPLTYDSDEEAHAWDNFKQFPSVSLENSNSKFDRLIAEEIRSLQLFPSAGKEGEKTPQKPSVAPTASTSKVPSAGTVRISFVYDGSLLAPMGEQGRVVISAWSSLNPVTTAAPIAWTDQKTQRTSVETTITLPLHDEFEYAKQVREGSAKPTYELGSLRTDSNVWFEALVEESSMLDNRAVYGRTGGGYAGVAELVQMSKMKQPVNVKLPLVLFGVDNEQKKIIKGYITITKVDFGDSQRELHRLFDAKQLLTDSPSRTELNQDNIEFIATLNATAIGRALYDVTNEDHYSVRETRAPNNRIRMPWYQTHQPAEALNRLPVHAYFLDQATLNPLPSDAPDDEKYMLQVFGYAAKRMNFTLKEMERIVGDQLKRTDAYYNPEFTECMAIMARAFVLVSNTFPYQADTRNLATRVDRYTRTTHSQVAPVESLDLAQQRGGGDCEDLAHYAYAHAQMLRRGKWQSSFLQAMQRAANLYDACMMLGSVTSPALGNDHHNAEKSAAHLRDAEHHRTVLLQTNGQPDDHLVRGETVRVVHKHTVRGSEEDMKKPVGGHSWMELIPKHKTDEWIDRNVPDSVKMLESRDGLPHASWKYFAPHMIVEGTGRINPLMMPAAYYATPEQNRDQLREQQLLKMKMFTNIISKSKIFHTMQSEAQPTSTVNTPHERFTEFYMQSTQMFTDAFLDKTGTCAFNWLQIDTEKTVDEQPVDPLFEKQDALSAQRLSTAAHNFMHSAASRVAQQSISPSNALAAHSFVAEKADETLAVGALIGIHSVQRVDPAKVSLGVDLEQRILDRPIASNIALQPFGAITPLEAKVLSSQMRQVYHAEKPSSRLKFFSTNPALKIAFVRQSTKNPNETDANAMARLVHNDKLVDEQRRRVKQVLDNVSQLFADQPWLSRKAAAKRNLVLQTFFFYPHDLLSDEAPMAISAEVARFRREGWLHTARSYVEEPTAHFQTVVIQLLCTPPQEQVKE